MSKRNKKKKKNENKQIKEYRIVPTNAECIEKGIYIFQFVLFIMGIIGAVAGGLCFMLSKFYGLEQYFETSIITIVLSFIVLFNYFTFGKFKEVRKKYGKGANKNDSGENRK